MTHIFEPYTTPIRIREILGSAKYQSTNPNSEDEMSWLKSGRRIDNKEASSDE